MNKELQSQLVNILGQISTSVAEAKDFTVSQLPDVAQQYITYGIWRNSVGLLITLLIFIGFCIGLKLCIRTIVSLAKKDLPLNENEEGILVVSATGGVVFTLGCIISAFTLWGKLEIFILVITAPKVWFILELKNLIS